MLNTIFLLVPLLEGFEWFDEGLQQSMKEAGWPVLTRPESMVMTHVQLGMVRPADIARSLRLSRQAVHATIGSLVERGVFALAPDPTHGRIRIVQLTAMGREMQLDAMYVVEKQLTTLSERLGALRMLALREALSANWGQPVVVPLPRDPAYRPPEPDQHTRSDS